MGTRRNYLNKAINMPLQLLERNKLQINDDTKFWIGIEHRICCRTGFGAPDIYETLHATSNHYKWDWPKSQFSMPDDSATIVWLRNIKVGYVYLYNFLQNTLKKISF